MFPISLQPNRADRQQNRACLCPARCSSPEICICPPPHPQPLLFAIQFSSSTRLRKRRQRAERRGQINQRPTPNYCCPNSYTRTMTEAWDWRADQRDDFFFSFFFLPLSSSLLLITTPMDTDGHSQSKRSNPLEGTQWVSHEPSRGRRPSVIGSEEAVRNSCSKKFTQARAGVGG